MRYRTLGRTGLKVSELCLGTMTFGEEWGFGAPASECARIFTAFAEAGGNFVDTANIYTGGASERILGELLRTDRDRFVVATKYTCSIRPDDPNAGGSHRKSLVQSLEESLRRLGTDHVDLLWVHARDPTTPTDEVLRALDDQVRLGKVLHLGWSDTPAWVVSRAHAIADLRGWTAPAAIQVPYSLAQRTPERELLPMARALGLTVTGWAPLSGGVLTGKYTSTLHDRAPAGSRLADPGRAGPNLTERNLRIAVEVERVASLLGASPAQVAIGWVRRRGVLPILGVRTVRHVKDALGVVELELGDDDVAILDELSSVELGFPHDFLARDGIADVVHGTVRTRVDAGEPFA